MYVVRVASVSIAVCTFVHHEFAMKWAGIEAEKTASTYQSYDTATCNYLRVV
jgi:hypothetical protein